MQYRTLGRTGLNASEIGFGGGRIRLGQDPKAIIEILHQAFDAGLNFVDTRYALSCAPNIFPAFFIVY